MTIFYSTYSTLINPHFQRFYGKYLIINEHKYRKPTNKHVVPNRNNNHSIKLPSNGLKSIPLDLHLAFIFIVTKIYAIIDNIINVIILSFIFKLKSNENSNDCPEGASKKAKHL